MTPNPFGAQLQGMKFGGGVDVNAQRQFMQQVAQNQAMAGGPPQGMLSGMMPGGMPTQGHLAQLMAQRQAMGGQVPQGLLNMPQMQPPQMQMPQMQQARTGDYWAAFQAQQQAQQAAAQQQAALQAAQRRASPARVYPINSGSEPPMGRPTLRRLTPEQSERIRNSSLPIFGRNR